MSESLLPEAPACSPTQARLLRSLADILDRPIDTLSADTEFADQGLDSLLALRWSRAIADAFGREVELEWFFDYPTVAQLAAFLDRHAGQCATPAP